MTYSFLNVRIPAKFLIIIELIVKKTMIFVTQSNVKFNEKSKSPMKNRYDNEAPQTGVFKNERVTLWVIKVPKKCSLAGEQTVWHRVWHGKIAF